MALREALQVRRLNGVDRAPIDHAMGYDALFDQVFKPGRGERIELVIVGGHKLHTRQAPLCMRSRLRRFRLVVGTRPAAKSAFMSFSAVGQVSRPGVRNVPPTRSSSAMALSNRSGWFSHSSYHSPIR